MSTEAGMSLLEQLKKVPDPRIERTRRHELMDMLVIALCAVICGADNWVDVVQFGKAKRAWFADFMKLPNGIASHDTFSRVFQQTHPRFCTHRLSPHRKSAAAYPFIDNALGNQLVLLI